MARVAVSGRVTALSTQNFLLRSEEFDNASWTKGDATVTADAIVAPDGTTTADKFVESAAVGAEHFVFQTVGASGISTCCSLSVSIKSDGSGRFVLLGLGFSGPFLCYDTVNRRIVAIANGSVSGGTVVRAEAVSQGNGWDRVTLGARFTEGFQAVCLIESRSTAGAARQAYTGDGASGFYMWGAQHTTSDWGGNYAQTIAAVVNTGTLRARPVTAANFILDNRNLAGANFADIATSRSGGQGDPNGGTEACKIEETAAVSAHSIYNIGSNISVAQPGDWFTGSVVWKAVERNFAGILMDLGSGSVSALWDLTTGARTNLTQAGTIHQQSMTIADDAVSLGNGWWRVEVSMFLLLKPPSGFFVQSILSNNGTSYGYLGVAGSGALAFAPAGAFANRAGPLTDTTAAGITQPYRIRNQARGRIVVP